MPKIAIVACSNGQERAYEEQNNELLYFLEASGYDVEMSRCLYAKNDVFCGTPQERAGELMRFFSDPDIREIYDISGGDIANQILPYLDYKTIAESAATLWGYSDLTTVLNAIYTITGKESVLYQVKNMVWGDCAAMQRERFLQRKELFEPKISFCRGDALEGILVGGNIRCFLKLAGTKYFPDLCGKVLLLESLGGRRAQIASYFAQLAQLGAFEKINGILLGNFREMEKAGCEEKVIELAIRCAGDNIPIAKTSEIGHKNDAKAIVIGRKFSVKNVTNELLCRTQD